MDGQNKDGNMSMPDLRVQTGFFLGTYYIDKKADGKVIYKVNLNIFIVGHKKVKKHPKKRAFPSIHQPTCGFQASALLFISRTTFLMADASRTSKIMMERSDAVAPSKDLSAGLYLTDVMESTLHENFCIGSDLA